MRVLPGCAIVSVCYMPAHSSQDIAQIPAENLCQIPSGNLTDIATYSSTDVLRIMRGHITRTHESS